MRVTGIGHALFAATMVALGVLGFATGHFAPIWAGFARTWPAREPLVWATAAVSLGGGLGMLWRRTTAPAAAVLTLALIAWLAVLKAPIIVAHPTDTVSYENAGETAVLAAAAWALFAGAAGSRRLRPIAGDRGLRLARALYGLAMIGFGSAHFGYARETASLVPTWLPAHLDIAYATGGAYIAAGIAILAGVLGRLAATLSALQMAGFTLLVWAPVIARGHPAAADWSEAVVSWTLTTAGWVVAESYRGRSWLGLRPGFAA